MQPAEDETLKSYPVWDAPTRWLHWLNASLVLMVGTLGLLLFFREDLQVEGRGAKILFKQLHSIVGYGLTVSLSARLAWGFFGNRYVRWRAVLPQRSTLKLAAREASALLKNGPAPQVLGHGPLGRLSTVLLLGTLLLLVSTGLVRAGTDIYFFPLGGAVARYGVREGVEPATLTPMNEKQLLDPNRTANINKLKTAAGLPHRYAAFALFALVFLHIGGVALKDIRHGGGLVSAMLTGRKLFQQRGTPPEQE